MGAGIAIRLGIVAAVIVAIVGLLGWAKIERGRAELARAQLEQVTTQRDQAVAVARANEAAIAQQRAEYEHQFEQLRLDRDRANQRARGLARFQQEVIRAREAILDQRLPDSVRDAIRDALSRGLSVAAIAKEVGLTKGTVDGLVRAFCT